MTGETKCSICEELMYVYDYGVEIDKKHTVVYLRCRNGHKKRKTYKIIG